MPSREEIINSLNACMDVHRSGLWSSGCAFCSYAKQSTPKCFMNLIKDATALLREEPEQKHGHWQNDKYGNMLCSVCGGLAIETIAGRIADWHLAPYLSNYCPQCGARMDEEVKQDG